MSKPKPSKWDENNSCLSVCDQMKYKRGKPRRTQTAVYQAPCATKMKSRYCSGNWRRVQYALYKWEYQASTELYLEWPDKEHQQIWVMRAPLLKADRSECTYQRVAIVGENTTANTSCWDMLQTTITTWKVLSPISISKERKGFLKVKCICCVKTTHGFIMTEP